MLSDDKVQSKMNFRTLIRRMWPYLWHHPRWLIGVLIAVLLYVIVGRSLPLLFGYVIDHGIKTPNPQLIFTLAMLYLGLEISRTVLAFVMSYSMQRLGNRVLFELREKLIRHVQNLPMTYFDKNPSGRIVIRITNDVGALGELFTQGFTAIFVNAFEMIAILVALFALSWKLALIAVLLGPLMVFLCLRISDKIRVLFQEAKLKLSTINAFTAESLNGMKVIQLFNREPQRRQRFNQMSKEYRDLNIGTVGWFALLWPVVEFFNLGSVLLALFFGSYYREQFSLTIGTITAFILLLQSFFRPLRVILEKYSTLQNSLASADRVFHLLDEPEEQRLPQGQKLPQMHGSIEFDQFSFRYSEAAPFALKNISLKIHPGERIALVGRTGSGKTSMVSLLQKFYPFEHGDLRLDGVSLRDMDASEVRGRVGVVQQDPFLFRGTLASNISLNDARIPRSRIEEAARLAYLTHFLKRHPEGLDAPVEERGSNLSVGERQLVAFARILAFNPDILILDEATANIDSVHEQWIQEATSLVTRGRTSLIIAHRLSTILDCDRIILLDKGEILEIGSHEELIKKNGVYARLYEAQFQRQNKEAELATPPLA